MRARRELGGERQNYYEESPVKLLIADFFGSHFPTSDSEHRLNLEGGADVEVPDIGDLETANNLPTKQLILHPGGTAVYELPTEDNSLFLMVKPGKKDPPPLFNNPFTDKANISIMVASVEGVPLVEVLCSVPENDRSSFASDYCVLSLESILEQASGSIRVTVSVSTEETRDAVLWQLELSPLDDSKRIKGTFEEEGRSLLRRTQEVEEFNTWLTLVSCVGKTGVGKSTIASLLSGNSTMFASRASSQGTTTLGADISTIIPSRDYKDRMEEVLGERQLFEPSSSRPLFLIDSEGMGFRGDEVDFVATGPVAIVANIIIWITEGRMRPDVVLGELREYLKGLDRISMGEATSQGNDYGEFVVVLNKMQEIADTNEELCDTLLEWGRSPEDDETIEDLNTRFKSITCIGIPMVQVGEGEEFGYSAIQRYPRFVQGLTTLGNQILSESDTPKNVKVGNELYQMNSTNAETIIGLLIDGANQGNIDLTDPCNVLYSLNKEKIVQGLSRMDAEFEQSTADKCDMTMFCSPCVCEYRNSVAAFTKAKLSESVINGVAEAEILCNNIEVRDSIQELIEKFIEPWYISNLCIGDIETSESDDVCDISELQKKFDQGLADDIVVECNTLHLCGTAVLHNSKLSLITKQIFISPGFQFEQEGPPKSPDGMDATTESGDGEDGSVGEEGKGITIEIQGSLLTASQSQMSVTLNGGEGGNGGNGGNGRDGISGESGENGGSGTDGEAGEKGTDGKSFSPDHSKDASTCGHVLTWQGSRPNGDAGKCCEEGHCCCIFEPQETGSVGFLSSIEEKVNLGCYHTHKYYQEYILSIDFIDPCDEGQLNGGDGTNGTAAGNGEQGKPGTDATMGTQHCLTPPAGATSKDDLVDALLRVPRREIALEVVSDVV